MTNNLQFKNNAGFKLFSYEGERIIYPNEPIRTYPYSSRELLSDVFIFEASDSDEHYVLVILKSNIKGTDQINVEDETYFTLSILSFIDIEIIEMPYRIVHQEEEITGTLKQQDFGGGITCDNFISNPQFILTLSRQFDVQFQFDASLSNHKCMLMCLKPPIDCNTIELSQFSYNVIMESLNPGFFFDGFSHLEVSLQQGQYLIVVANEPEENKQKTKEGKFRFIVRTMENELSEKPKISSKIQKKDQFFIERVVKKKYNFEKQLFGEWNKKNSKGTYRMNTDSYQAFLKNPGFIIYTSEDTLFSCHLHSINKQSNQTPDSLSICIYEITENFKFNCILDDDNYAPIAWGCYSNDIVLKENKYGYLLLCLNFEKGALGKFELILQSDKDFKEVQNNIQLTKKQYGCQLKGFWNKANAGGCITEKTFLNNPKFEISTNGTCEAIIEIYSSDPYPLGLYLIKSNEKNSKLTEKEIKSFESSSTFLIELACLKVQLQNDQKYVLIPCTYRPGQIGKYLIEINSSEPIFVNEIREPNV